MEFSETKPSIDPIREGAIGSILANKLILEYLGDYKSVRSNVPIYKVRCLVCGNEEPITRTNLTVFPNTKCCLKCSARTHLKFKTKYKVGDKFGCYTLLKPLKLEEAPSKWLIKCDCGREYKRSLNTLHNRAKNCIGCGDFSMDMVDLTDQILGAFTVLNFDEVKSSGVNLYWVAKCNNCGIISSLHYTSIMSSEKLIRTRCRKCMKVENSGSKTEDLTGKVCSNLTVLGFSHKDIEKQERLWFTRCKCGAEHVTSSGTLNAKIKDFKTLGKTADCEECYKTKYNGQKFANFTVIKFDKLVKNERSGKRVRYYKVRCNCGKEYSKHFTFLTVKTKTADENSKCVYCRSFINNITVGQKFSKIEIMEINKKDKKIKVKCDCGLSEPYYTAAEKICRWQIKIAKGLKVGCKKCAHTRKTR